MKDLKRLKEERQDSIKFLPPELRMLLYTRDENGIYRPIPEMHSRWNWVMDNLEFRYVNGDMQPFIKENPGPYVEYIFED